MTTTTTQGRKMKDEILTQAQLQMLRELAKNEYTKEGMDAKNTLYFIKKSKTDEDKQIHLDEGFVSLLTNDQVLLAVRFAVGRVGYAEVLRAIMHNLSYDAGDRGESGFAPFAVAVAGDKAMKLLLEAKNLLTKNPPTPY